MAHAEGDVRLRELVEVGALRYDVADVLVVVLAGTLLAGHVGLAEEEHGPLHAVLQAGALHILYGGELCAVVGQYQGKQLPEGLGPDGPFDVVERFDHRVGGLLLREDRALEAYVGPVEREQHLGRGLGALDAVHLYDADVVVLLHVGEVVLPQLPDLPDVEHLLVLHLALGLVVELDLEAQVDVPRVELAGIYEPVKRRHADGELVLECGCHVVHGIAVFDHRRHHIIDGVELLASEVEACVSFMHALVGLFVGLLRVVEILFPFTVGTLAAPVADVGSLLKRRAHGLDVVLTVTLAQALAVTADLAALHVAADVLALAAVLVGAVVLEGLPDLGVQLDVPADCGVVALELRRDLGDGRPVVEPVLDDDPFLV